MYDVSRDFLRRVPADELPRMRVSKTLTLYAIEDLDAYFNRFRTE